MRVYEMAKIIDKFPITKDKPDDDLEKALAQEWGYVLFYEKGDPKFVAADVPIEERRHALESNSKYSRSKK
jgi:hypothetical protein